MICCQTPLLSVLLFGWTYRFMQRAALKAWWKAGNRRRGHRVTFIDPHHQEQPSAIDSFDEFASGDSETFAHRSWPNWFLHQSFRTQFSSRPVVALFHSLWLNLRIGVAGAFNTFVLTLPGCALMLFGWYDGWNNSFNKGYEQFLIGPGVSILGVIMFAVAMLYVPMAQARQAVSGKWRAFYDWRLVWRLIRLRWLQSIGLSVVYCALWTPILILRVSPTFWPQIKKLTTEQLDALTPAQVATALNSYFFWCALLVVPAYVFVRWLAARNYAFGLQKVLQHGLIEVGHLSPFERSAFARLNLLEVTPPPRRALLLHLAARLWRLAIRSAAVGAMLLVWIWFVVELYISQFFHYIPGAGWLNNCMVQLPWFHFIP